MKCLVSITDPERERSLVELALRVAGNDEVVLASVIEVAPDETLSAAQPEARARRRELDVLAGTFSTAHPRSDATGAGSARTDPGGSGVGTPERIRTLVTVARPAWQGIRDAVVNERPGLLVVPWRRPGWDYMGTTTDAILRDPPCDVAVVKGSFQRVRRLLVPVRGGRYAQLAVDLALAFARSARARVSFLHVMARDGQRRDLYRIVGDRVMDEHVEQLLSRVGDPAATIAEELGEHDAIVLGATAREGTSDQLGPVGQAIVRSGKPAIVVRTRTPVASEVFAAPRLPTDRTERSRVIGELVDKWFVENTFTSSEFAELPRLVEAKERQGLRISVGLPTLNEEATIGKVIRTIRSRLMERFPLVDELVVIDSRSEDRTREVARAEGVPVHIHQDTLPECGAYSGKGETLWKSLHILSGDLVVWVDTDVSNIHPKFVYGILGPLLRRPEIAFVKAFYQRPLRIGGELQATGGGRVTELTARPILNLFYPELSGMVQPLSGEQGGRRSLLEQLPFFTGYGVETGLLIDALQRAGLRSIAQVDMKQRIHRNQSLYALSKMSFEILQVVLKRVGESHGERLWEDANSTIKLIAPGPGGRLHLEVQDIAAVERPPMATVPAYRVKRGL